MATKDNKFTQALCDRFVEIVRRGNFRETACAEVGIDPATMRRWLREAAAGDKRKQKFVAKLDEAEAEAEDVMVIAIRKAALADWRAAAWYLERRGPKRWGFKAQVEHTVEGELQRILDAIERELGPDAAARVFGRLTNGEDVPGTPGGSGTPEGGGTGPGTAVH